MIYNHLKEKIIELIGTNGYELCKFQLVHSYLEKLNFEKALKLVEDCDILKDSQKDYLKSYINSFKTAC